MLLSQSSEFPTVPAHVNVVIIYATLFMYITGNLFKELVLSGNEINKSAANVVAAAVENKEKLTLLDLDCE